MNKQNIQVTRTQLLALGAQAVEVLEKILNGTIIDDNGQKMKAISLILKNTLSPLAAGDETYSKIKLSPDQNELDQLEAKFYDGTLSINEYAGYMKIMRMKNSVKNDQELMAEIKQRIDDLEDQI